MMRGFGGIGHPGVFAWISVGVGLLITLAVIAVVVMLVILLVRRLGAYPQRTGSPMAPIVPSQSPKDIASARYAKGEITREEYQQILADLGHGS